MLSDIRKIILCLVIWNFLTSIMSKKIGKSNQFENSITNAVAEIVKSCHTNNKSSILASGEFYNKDIRQIMLNPKPIIIRNNLKLSKHVIEDTVEVLIVSTNSVDHLRRFFSQVKNSVLWNRLRYNIIFNKFDIDENCNRFSFYLATTWRMDLLNSIFLCITSKKRIKIYTFNPYTNWAPKPWKFVKKLKEGKNNWNVYVTEYRPDSAVCNNLFFDKTHRLDGYKGIKAVAYVPTRRHMFNMSYDANINIKKAFDISMATLLFNKLNVPFVHKSSNHYGTFDKDGISTGIDRLLANNDYDLLLDYRFLAYTNGAVQSSSILGETGVTFISHYRGNVSTLLQIVHYFKPIIMFFSLVVLALTIAILKVSINENFSAATIEVFRLFFNGPLLRVPESTSPRIYIFTIFIFILVMQTILRSKILSFMMTPESNDLETFADLEYHENYKIYCKRGFNYLLPDTLKDRCINVHSFSNLYDQKKTALVHDHYPNLGLAYRQKMHHSRETISKHCIIYRMRKSWPLITKVNNIYTRVFESGISGIQLKWAKIKIVHDLDRNINEADDRRALNLRDLNFAFQTLMFGMICAFLMFLIENKFWELVRLYSNRIIQAFRDD